jgi:SAM-dependent methyltransferase
VSVTAGRRADARSAFPDWRFAPNIGGHPDVYEIENRALDPDGYVLDAMRRLAPWNGRRLLDLGCGTGFWLPGYAGDAARVIGVEPDPVLRERAATRIQDVPGAEVAAGSAEHLPLPDRAVDVVHARFAYFLTPGTEPRAPGKRGAAPSSEQWAPAAGGVAYGSGRRTIGAGGAPTGGGRRAPGEPEAARHASAGADAGLAEIMRVLTPGGSLIVVENDYLWGQFAGILAAGSAKSPRDTAAAVDAWWRQRGATRHEVRTQWRFASRADLAAVLRIEVPAGAARAWLTRNPSATSLSCGYVLYAVTRGDHAFPPP